MSRDKEARLPGPRARGAKGKKWVHHASRSDIFVRNFVITFGNQSDRPGRAGPAAVRAMHGTPGKTSPAGRLEERPGAERAKRGCRGPRPAKLLPHCSFYYFSPSRFASRVCACMWMLRASSADVEARRGRRKNNRLLLNDWREKHIAETIHRSLIRPPGSRQDLQLEFSLFSSRVRAECAEWNSHGPWGAWHSRRGLSERYEERPRSARQSDAPVQQGPILF